MQKQIPSIPGNPSKHVDLSIGHLNVLANICRASCYLSVFYIYEKMEDRVGANVVA